MDPIKTQKSESENSRVNLKLKLAALWAAVMFLYVYVDYFALYMPGKLEGILNGRVYKFAITPVFLTSALVSVTVPALMIFLSVALRASLNRWVNVGVALLYIPFTLFNLAGDTWPHMVFGAAVEVVLLCLVVCYAWTWPRVALASSQSR